MEKLFTEATKRHFLRSAWHSIRANGIRSPQQETRDAVDEFERDAEGNIARIQRGRTANGTGGRFGIAPSPLTHNSASARKSEVAAKGALSSPPFTTASSNVPG